MILNKVKFCRIAIINLIVLLTIGNVAIGEEGISNISYTSLPYSLSMYKDFNAGSLQEIIWSRVQEHPFNWVATILFFCAVIHTFFASYFIRLAHRLESKYGSQSNIPAAAEKTDEDLKVFYTKKGKEVFYFWIHILHFLGEIEIIFALWLLPLIGTMLYFFNWATVAAYFDHSVNYTESIFVILIMGIAGTKPILQFAEAILKRVAYLGKSTPAAWWLSILTLAPLLGSFITEPAAMTIAAFLLGKKFYECKPSKSLAYATLGLLFVNISIGGTFTHFAAPPVLMVVDIWGWDFVYMLKHFAWKSLISIALSNWIYYLFFKKEFSDLYQKSLCQKKSLLEAEIPMPSWIVCVHILFLCWTIFNLHNTALAIGGFFLFLGFLQVTHQYQSTFTLRQPVLVGIFLAGLVSHGTLQQWWLEPTLGRLTEIPLFMGATFLTSFNDNAAITYLASLVPSFQSNPGLQQAVVAGALTGGGLTVIANAPNPAGQSILSPYFENEISPFNLFLGALIPTCIAAICFLAFP